MHAYCILTEFASSKVYSIHRLPVYTMFLVTHLHTRPTETYRLYEIRDGDSVYALDELGGRRQ